MNKIVVIAYLLFLLFGCQNQNEYSNIQGLWIHVPNETNPISGGIIHCKEDSIVLWKEDGLKTKSKFELNGSIIKVSKRVNYFYNYPEGEDFEVNFEIRNDTLFWDDNRFQFRKSKFGSKVEDYANSKGLTIDLPEINQHKMTDFSSFYPLDFFIGYQKNGEIGIVIGDESAEYFQTGERIKKLQDTLYYKRIMFRVFADKSIKMSHIFDIHTTMFRTNNRLIHYVTKNPNINSYSEHYSGLKAALSDIKLIEEKTTYNNGEHEEPL